MTEAPPPEILPPPPEEVDFQARVHRLTPRLWVTPALVAINLVVFAVMLISGVHPMAPEIQDLIDWQANFGPMTIGEGEWWRLATSMFLHIGALHIAFNMYVLWSAGPLIERLLGNIGFLAMYVISGLAGSLASLAWHPDVVSAGASGAVFGVFGALFGFLLVRRHEVPLGQLTQLRNGAAMFVLFNVVFGASKEGIDMAAHFGGLGAGFVCGLILALPVTPASRSRRPRRYAILALVGAIAIGVGAAALPRPFDYIAVVERADQVAVRYDQAVVQFKDGTMSTQEFLELVEDDILPAWRQIRGELEDPEVPSDVRQRLSGLLDVLRLRQEYFELLIEAVESNDPGAIERMQAKEKETQQAMERLDR